MDQRRLYIVRGSAKNGTITYKCPTADWALRKLRDFQAAGHQHISVTDPDGTLLTKVDLIGSEEGSGAAPSEEAIPVAPQIARRR